MFVKNPHFTVCSFFVQSEEASLAEHVNTRENSFHTHSHTAVVEHEIIGFDDKQHAPHQK